MDTIKPMDAEQAVKGVACQISVTTQLTEKRHIVIQTYMDRDAPISGYHSLLDKLGAATDRQEAKYRLEGLHTALEVHEKTQKQLETDYANIGVKQVAEWQQRGKKGSPTLSASEAAQKSNAEQNIKRYRQEIDKIKAEIAQCEATIAKVD